MSRTTVPACLDALKAQLEARPGLAGVRIGTAPLGDEVTDSIELGYRVPSTQGWAALGKRGRNDNYTITGIVWRSKKGAGEAVAKEVRDRVFDLFAELEEQLRDDPHVNGTLIGGTGAELTRAELTQWYADGHRMARLEFDISCKARI